MAAMLWYNNTCVCVCVFLRAFIKDFNGNSSILLTSKHENFHSSYAQPKSTAFCNRKHSYWVMNHKKVYELKNHPKGHWSLCFYIKNKTLKVKDFNNSYNLRRKLPDTLKNKTIKISRRAYFTWHSWISLNDEYQTQPKNIRYKN